MSETDTEQFMSLSEFEALDEGNTVGVLQEWERGPETVEFSGVGHKLRRYLNDSVGDESSRLFIICDGGELSISYEPGFDAPIVTNLTKEQARMALQALRSRSDERTVDLLFDDAGPVVFRSGDVMTVATPTWFPWTNSSCPQRPVSPPQPRVGGGGDE